MSFVESLRREESIDTEVTITNCDSETAQRIIKARQRLIAEEKGQLSAIRKLWPDGLQFINKFNEFIITQEEFYDNLIRWGEFLRKTRVTISDHKAMEENRKYVFKNRKLASRTTSLMIAANEILKNETGLDIENYS